MAEAKEKPKQKYVGFLIRFVAAIIDGVVLVFIQAAVGRGVPFFGGRLVGPFVGALYSILLWVNWNGQTLGKKAMGIKVVKEDGKPLGYSEAVVRYVGYIISIIPLGLGYFWVIWDEKKQGFHDKIAKTLVVKE